jgi:hypothetical protein
MTDCKQSAFEFQDLHERKVVADFDGGNISSDGGLLVLREVEQARGWIKHLTSCFTDFRDARWVQHKLQPLLTQRIFALAQGYEDLNDHDRLRVDPLLSVACERDPEEELSGRNTLNRLENGTGKKDRYHKIDWQEESVADLFVEQFIRFHRTAPVEAILDLDATDNPIHGQQEGRFFHGYYRAYCYLPLYIFCGDHLLCAKLRPSNIDASAGALEEIQRIVRKLREVWPTIRIILRGDSGFCRDDIMTWCEANSVDYVFGLARNSRLEAILAPALRAARVWHELTGCPQRAFMDFAYQTLDSWSRARRVVGKAEWLVGGGNPRFVVTSLSAQEVGACVLYERTYCGRGDMENRIKEQQLDLFADRTSTHLLRSNQLRLYMASIAYSILRDLRELGLKGTAWSQAQCGTLRTRLLKIGAMIRVSVRRVLVRFSSAFPLREVVLRALQQLRQWPTVPNTT